MAMTGVGLAAARQAAIDAVSYTQTNNAGAAVSYGAAILLADSQAIVDYIHSNAHATGNDSRGDTHNLDIV